MRTLFHFILMGSLAANLAGLALAVYAVQRVGGVNVIRLRLQGGGNTPHYQARTEHFRGLPRSSGGIVFLGDSITQRCEWAELLDDTRALNRGIDGDKAAGVLARLDEIVALQPQAIFLMIGVNDLLSRPPRSTAETIGGIIRRIRRELPDCQLVVQSVLPVNNAIRESFVEPSDILELNRLLQRLADRYGGRYLDLHPHFADDHGRLKAELTHDGIHLGGAGYARWLAILVDAGLLAVDGSPGQV